MAKSKDTKLPSPWLKKIWLKDELIPDRRGYPFNIPLFRGEGFELEFTEEITVIVGDNGSGKSTLLEAIATLAGFGRMGGSSAHQTFEDDPWDVTDGNALSKFMGAGWLPKMSRGWFFRAESFFALAQFLETAANDSGEEGPGFLEYSHGEGFMRAFRERFTAQGLYIMDEPESALSPHRQFEFIKFILEQKAAGRIQAVIATHSPILMAIPDARLLHLSRSGLEQVRLQDLPHFRLYREFCLDPYGTVEAMITD